MRDGARPDRRAGVEIALDDDAEDVAGAVVELGDRGQPHIVYMGRCGARLNRLRGAGDGTLVDSIDPRSKNDRRDRFHSGDDRRSSPTLSPDASGYWTADDIKEPTRTYHKHAV